MRKLNTEEYSWGGIWWIPESQQTFSGRLTYSPKGGFSLDLEGEGFTPAFERAEVKPKIFTGNSATATKFIFPEHDVIHGDADGQKITLFDVRLMNFGSHTPMGSVFRVESLVEGSHVEKDDAAVVTFADFSIDDLHLWLGMNQESDVPGNEELCIAELDDGASVAVIRSCFSSLTAENHNAHDERKRNESLKLRYTPKEACSFSEINEVGRNLANLISLGRDRACGVHAIEAAISGSTDTVAFMVKKNWGEGTERGVSRSNDPIFNCRDVPFATIMPKWYSFYKRHHSVANLLLSLRVEERTFLEAIVVLSGTLAEVFHGSVINKNGEYSTEAKKLVKKVLGNSKRETLFGRLADLYYCLPADLSRPLNLNIENWARTHRNSRNDIVHEAGLQEVKPAQALASAELTIALVSLHVYREIGVPERIILNALSESESFRRAVGLAEAYLRDTQPEG